MTVEGKWSTKLIQGTTRQIDSFDQWDVEFGKVLAEKHHPRTQECLMTDNSRTTARPPRSFDITATQDVRRCRLKKGSEKCSCTTLGSFYAGALIGTTQTSFLLTNSCIPRLESSRPYPECLTPPNGNSGAVQVG